jgi:hypothetical protein
VKITWIIIKIIFIYIPAAWMWSVIISTLLEYQNVWK